MRWIVLALIGVMLMFAATYASAEPRGHGGWGGHGHGHGGWSRPWYRPVDPGTAFWGGVVGGALGSLLRGQQDDEDDEEDTDELRPFTPAWYDYCRRKYRSFNQDTGRYLGFDGELHLCK